jgi:hypothetical protein
MKKFVFEYNESDGFHYFITVPVFIEYESEEDLYIDVCEAVKKAATELLNRITLKSKKNDIISDFNSSLYDCYFKFKNKDLPFEGFVYLDDNKNLKIDFNIYSLEDYFSSQKLK